jgi:hypothetical protein
LYGVENGGPGVPRFKSCLPDLYAPDGVTRATYLNLEGSSVISKDNYFLRVVGGSSDTAPR